MVQTQVATVSVIIPAYNYGKYLDNAIRSVLGQTYKNVECIVIDDGSTDNTRQIAESYERVTYIYQDNAGLPSARNKGISHAYGEYISFLDADDIIAPSKLADQVAFLDSHINYDVVYSKVKFFHDKTPESFFPFERITPSGDILNQLLLGNFITVHSPLIRKLAIEAVGGFKPSLSSNEDWEFLLRLALSGARFGFIDTYHAFYRLHESNMSRDEIGMFESRLNIVSNFVAEYSNELQRKGVDTGQILAYHQADYGKALIVHARVAEGRRNTFAACRTRIPNRCKYLLYALGSYILSQSLLVRLGSKGRLYGDDVSCQQ